MRITKKVLRETKRAMKKRIKELCLMSEEQLEKEVKRCYPSLDFKASRGVLLGFMLQDLLDLALPIHWHE